MTIIRHSAAMLIAALTGHLALLPLAAADPPAKKGPPFTISKETTYLTEPLRADGYPDYLAYLERKMSRGVTPENNAFVAILRLTGTSQLPNLPGYLLPQMRRKLGWDDEKEQVGSFKTVETFTTEETKNEFDASREFDRQFSLAKEVAWVDSRLPQVARWLQINSKVLDGLAEASKKPMCYVPILVSNESGAFSFHQRRIYVVNDLAGALLMRGLNSAAMRKIQQAHADAMTIHRLARHCARGPFALDLASGYGLERAAAKIHAAIAHHGNLTAAQARAFAAEVAALPSFPSLLDKMEAERLRTLDILAYSARLEVKSIVLNEYKLRGLSQMLGRHGVDREAPLIIVNEFVDRVEGELRFDEHKELKRKLAVFDDYQKLVDASPKSEAEWWACGLDPQRLPRQLGEAIACDWLELELLRNVQGCHWGEVRVKALRDEVQIVYALAAYRADEAAYPKELKALVPKYLATLPLDPCSGKSYLFREERSGFVVWSVGLDQVDDGGDEENSLDFPLRVK